MCFLLSICIITYLFMCHSRFTQVLIICISIRISLHSIHHIIKECSTITCWKEFTPWYCYITISWWSLDIYNTIICLIKSTMVNPYIRTALFYSHIIPVITVISTTCFIVPFPEFIKLNVSYNYVVRTCYIYTCMCNLSTILRIDCKIAHTCKL